MLDYSASPLLLAVETRDKEGLVSVVPGLYEVDESSSRMLINRSSTSTKSTERFRENTTFILAMEHR